MQKEGKSLVYSFNDVYLHMFVFVEYVLIWMTN